MDYRGRLGAFTLIRHFLPLSSILSFPFQRIPLRPHSILTSPSSVSQGTDVTNCIQEACRLDFGDEFRRSAKD